MISLKMLIPSIVAAILGLVIGFYLTRDEVITGTITTEGKIVVVGNKAVQQERLDGKTEYMENITNMDSHRKNLQTIQREGKSVRILWTATKHKYPSFQENRLDKIE
ncbi:MAG: hypothetical protein US25_C0009G0005 [Candidatus Moranbacteria bacterium GW2011_GWE1_36_7]|nr:MAG: hypothetical protein UR99_C0032G0008 [Candidatus Moranbacteria bacterium GW2011_GWD2_36_12]KKQ06648.1 MAG: hypothetical protein US16_C0012G0008 [Candidatus Moranbacteria bacterium GW2011_GWE2_36_40]KKQ15196.1 MAG: hypothetical protein US25_C0009G0005 [Candidatus Moranbacteria bacterium GW2011_GWE1_36_7]